jgi:adenine phosphoribosyltransferase
MDLLAQRLARQIRDVQDFPTAGILFKDITPVLSDPALFGEVVRRLGEQVSSQAIEVVAGIESRGFLFAAPVALLLGSALVPVRKPGKLPHQTARVEYALEYGTDVLEMHRDAVRPGQRVLIVDDVLATGGTAAAAAELVRSLGGVVAGAAFVVELGFLHGRDRLDGMPLTSLVSFS